MAWYVVVTKPAQEFKALENLTNQGYETFLPTCQVQKKKGSSLQFITEPLFRRYLFIELNQVTSNWFPIRSTKGVNNLLRFGVDPIEVSEDVLSELRQRHQQTPVIQEVFKTNEELLVKSGPFAGLSGFFERIIHQASGEVRALLLVELLGKQQKLSLQITDVSAL